MKVLLLHPPGTRDTRPDDRTESLGLGYIAAVLRRDGHEVEVFDAHLQCLDARETIRRILASSFDCLGITAMHQERDLLITIARAVRRQKKDVLIVGGGSCATLDTERLLLACPELDLVVRGEGESTASDVFGRIARTEQWQDTPGIGYLDGRSSVITPLGPLIKDLDSLPFPARDALKQGPQSMWASISSSRGCYHRCSFCSVNSFYELSGGHAPRFRSPSNVVDEIESVIASTAINKFTFVDDDFIGPGKAREHCLGIVEQIRERKLDINFSVECRADEIDEDLLNLMKEAGLIGVFLGIESGVQRQLDTYNKRITVEQNKRAIDIVRKVGLKMQPGFIPFDPYTTMEELQENIQFTQEVRLWEGKAGPTPMKTIIFPGVPLVDQLRADGLLRDNGKDLDYAFQDKRVAMVWKSFQMTAKSARIVHSVKKSLGLNKQQ